MFPDRQSYADYRRELAAEQAGKSRAEIAAELASESEASFDPETAVAPQHNWIDRGVRFSCEHAGHPQHYAYKQPGGTAPRLHG